MSKFYLVTILFFLSANLSFAFMCPTTFNQAEMGQKLDEVIAACGKPDKKEEVKKVNTSDNIPQEWTYYIPQNASSAGLQQSGSLKTTVTFDAAGNVISMNVNGIGVGDNNVCGVTTGIGSSKEDIKSACGTPIFIQKQNTEAPKKEEVTVTTLTYNSNPSTTLIFENGVLVEKQ